MTVMRTVRVTRTWDLPVEAEYGDTYESLCAKVSEETLDNTAPDAEQRVVVEEHDSKYETLQEYLDDHPEEGSVEQSMTPVEEN